MAPLNSHRQTEAYSIVYIDRPMQYEREMSSWTSNRYFGSRILFKWWYIYIHTYDITSNNVYKETLIIL